MLVNMWFDYVNELFVFIFKTLFQQPVFIFVALHTVPHVTLLVSKGKFTSGLDFFLSPPENKKAFAL